jgi:hypothetical protein
MSRIIKGTLNLNIGYSNANQIGDFEFEVEDNTTDKEINDIIQEYWRDWIWNFIDGGWEIESDNNIWIIEKL